MITFLVIGMVRPDGKVEAVFLSEFGTSISKKLTQLVSFYQEEEKVKALMELGYLWFLGQYVRQNGEVGTVCRITSPYFSSDVMTEETASRLDVYHFAIFVGDRWYVRKPHENVFVPVNFFLATENENV
jgi:hypothetical protein